MSDAADVARELVASYEERMWDAGKAAGADREILLKAAVAVLEQAAAHE